MLVNNILLILLPHSKNISFQAQGIVWIICRQLDFLPSSKSNFALKSSQLLILLFQKINNKIKTKIG